MLDRLRGSLKGTLDSLGRGAAKLSPNPSVWTWVGMVFPFLAFIYYGGGHLAAGGIWVSFAGFFDVLDGAVARASGRTSPRGAFLDSTLDRVAEVVIYLGIIGGGYASPFLVMLALSLSLLVSYARAKGDALGVSLAGVGIGERSERLLVLIIASLLGLLSLGLLIIILIALVTFVQRTVRIMKALGRVSA